MHTKGERTRTLKRTVVTVLAALALGAAAVSPATAAATPAKATGEVRHQTQAIRVAQHWVYLGRYYDLRACQNAVEFATKPSGPYDDAECRAVIDSNGSIAYWELWGVQY